MGWEQLPALCIYLTPPPFNSSVYPLEKKCMLLLLFYSQKALLLVSLSQPVDAAVGWRERFLLLQPGATTWTRVHIFLQGRARVPVAEASGCFPFLKVWRNNHKLLKLWPKPLRQPSSHVTEIQNFLKRDFFFLEKTWKLKMCSWVICGIC